MSVGDNRFIAIWASHEARERLWRRLCITSALLLGMSLLGNLVLVRRPLAVVRVDPSGVPELIQLRYDDPSQTDPSEREIRAFAASFAVFLMRGDSFSVRHDWAYVSGSMSPRLYRAFQAQAIGTPQTPGAVALIEGLRQRTDVPVESLEIEVDKKPYPWRARVKGKRVIVGTDTPVEQPFEVELELLRTQRRPESLEGLVVWDLHTKGEALSVPVPSRPEGGE